MKIKIIYNKKNGVWGGANQFIRALESEFASLGCLAFDNDSADVFLLNSYQNLIDFLKLKRKYPNKIFIHRLGPIFYYYRGNVWKMIDKLTIEIANKFADLTVFQSFWSYNESVKLGFDKNKKYAIIGNATDQNVFKKISSNKKLSGGKIKLITDSWSKNIYKGFEYLKYLDENLDWNKYEMSFVGNTAIEFKNIKIIPAMPSEKLVVELNNSDIFIAPFKFEACSNSIIEAMSCGLPVIALDSGGNSEIVENGGELFIRKEELLERIKLVSDNYDYYQNKIKVFNIKEIAENYIEFIKKFSSSDKKEFDKNKYWFFYFKIFFYKKIISVFSKFLK